jgi:Lactonase, 7-bladed beta-propeller
VAVDPTAKFFYVANFSSNNVSAYGIGSNGGLTPVSGSPFPAGVGPVSVAVNDTAKFAYVVNFNSKNVSVYSIGSNGGLTPVSGSPFPAGVGPGQRQLSFLFWRQLLFPIVLGVIGPFFGVFLGWSSAFAGAGLRPPGGRRPKAGASVARGYYPPA